eukprot:TRINITY_DN15967_c0_g1_i1.p1 TRINITY_DN15967_c0_g1~~TRINITY_DN15967_c0_g1_i1.p1  ORF type:complete len:107 (+),score=10.26 TRINITY_DN15967_c0_g1_i1:32-322(+)
MVVGKGKGSLVKYYAGLEGDGTRGWLVSEVKEPAYAKNKDWVLNEVVLLGATAPIRSFWLGSVEVSGNLTIDTLETGTKIAGLEHPMGETLDLSWE